MTTAIRASGVHVELGSAHILLGIDFELKAGRTLAIVGSNGSGKSTLLRALVGAIPISAGRIELFGKNLASRRSVDWGRIGYAPQRVTATSGVPATALEAVTGGLVYGNRLRPPRAAKEKALAALAKVGLEHRAHESVQTFSGGQQQRILTARALVREPDMIVLDEPFAGVDTDSRQAILEVLRGQQAEGKTLVLVLHEVHEYLDLIDEALILDAGRVREHTADVSSLRGSGYHADPSEAPHFRSPYMEGPL